VDEAKGQVSPPAAAPGAHDPVRYRIRRAADVARDLAGRIQGPLRIVAEALATELEILADA